MLAPFWAPPSPQRSYLTLNQLNVHQPVVNSVRSQAGNQNNEPKNDLKKILSGFITMSHHIHITHSHFLRLLLSAALRATSMS